MPTNSGRIRNSINIEQSQNPEIETPHPYGAIVVLGAGFESHADSSTEEKRLTQESRIRATASGILSEQLDVPVVVYSGGKTGGPDNPSEAEAMFQYAKRLYPQIADRRILFEEKSWDTSTNAEFVAEELAQNHIEGSVILLTSEPHLERADHHFLTHGVDTTPMSAEQFVASRSPHHEKFIRQKLESLGNLKAEAIEAILRSMLVIDPSGDMPRKLGEKRIG